MNRWRNCSTALSSDGQRATIPHNYQGRPSFTSVYFWPTRTRESTPANANNSVLAKNPGRSWIFWAEPKSARIFTSEILKMNPTLRYFVPLTLKLASNQLHASSSNWCQGSHNKLKGTMIRVLVEENFDRDYVCHMAIKVSRSTFTTAMCKCTIITLLDDSNLNAFQTFWPRLNILRLVDTPKIIDDCNFRSADLRVSLSNFSFN